MNMYICTYEMQSIMLLTSLDITYYAICSFPLVLEKNAGQALMLCLAMHAWQCSVCCFVVFIISLGFVYFKLY